MLTCFWEKLYRCLNKIIHLMLSFYEMFELLVVILGLSLLPSIQWRVFYTSCIDISLSPIVIVNCNSFILPISSSWFTNTAAWFLNIYLWASDMVCQLQGWLPGLKADGDSNQLPTIAIVASYDTFGAAPVSVFCVWFKFSSVV